VDIPSVAGRNAWVALMNADATERFTADAIISSSEASSAAGNSDPMAIEEFHAGEKDGASDDRI
jgi:hypothetical protein